MILDLMVLMQSTTKPTINLVILGVIDIEMTLENIIDGTTSELRQTASLFKQNLASDLRDCITRRMRPFSAMEILGALLDPEMKNISKVRAEIPGGDAAELLFDAVRNHGLDCDEDESDDVEILSEPPPKLHRASLIAKYANVETPYESLSNQIERYLASPVSLSQQGGSEGRDRVLQWWFENAETFPSLARLARCILSIPATSAEPERRFSSAGNALRERRCSMSPITMSKTLFVHDNRGLLPTE